MMRLPPGWAETIDDKGRKYFYNSSTGASSWEPPQGTQYDQPSGPPKPPGPPPRQGGPPPISSGGPPQFGTNPRSGPPPMLSIPGSSSGGPPPSPMNRTGPPSLSGNLPPPSPMNRTGPPPIGSLPPPSPMNRTGPPSLPSPGGGPPSMPGSGPPMPSSGPPPTSSGFPSMPGQGPPMPSSGPPPRTGAPPPPVHNKSPTQVPGHLQGGPFSTSPPQMQVGAMGSNLPPMRAPGMSISGGPPPPQMQVGAMGSNLPPMRAPGMSISGGPPPPPIHTKSLPPTSGLPSQTASPQMQVGTMGSNLPPPRAPGMSVSGGPPQIGGMLPPGPPQARAPGMSIGGLPPPRAPGMSMSGPPGGIPMMAPGMPPTRAPGMSVSGPPPQFLIPDQITPASSHQSTLPPTAENQSFGNAPLPYPWKEAASANGKPYYYNSVTNKTVWERSAVFSTEGAALGGAVGSSNDLANLPQTGEKLFVKTFAGSVTMRSGMFKSWEPRYMLIKSTSLFSIYDNDQMKKERIKGSIAFFLVVPINRGDGKNVLVIYEYAKTQPNETTPFKDAKYTHYFDCGSNEIREQIINVLYDQGAIIRRPLFEAQCLVNKEARFVTAFPNTIEIYKKSSDDEPDIILQYLPKTFFQDTPSQFPLLYEDGKVYGPVTPHTFVISDHCDEDSTLFYITIQSGTNPNVAANNPDDDHVQFIKSIRNAVNAKQTPVDSTSLLEGYLYKASTNLQRWARRYFILRRDSLTYYKNRGDEKAAGECNLPNGFEVNLHPDSITHPFPLFVAESGDEGTRQYLMCALNDPDYETWCNTLSTLQQQKQVKKDPSSLKEGYINFCGKKQTPHRKYVVVRQESIRVFNSRLDETAALEIPLPKGCYISEAQLPGDDTLGTQRLSILSVINPQTNDEHFFGVTQPKEREEWIAVLKSIAGDAVAKSHPQSYCEGYVYKSKKKGTLGSLKYCVITPQILFYTDKKESDVLSADPQVQKRVKKFQQTGDAPLEEDLTSIPGYKGLIIPSTGDESGGEVVYLYYSDDAEFERAKTAYLQAVASVDWRRNEHSIFEGYIWKSNTNGKSWTWRYAIVTNDAVSFYKRKFDKDLAGQMPLAGCTFTTTPMSDLNSPTISKDDRVALDNFGSQFKSAMGSSLAVRAIAANVTQDQLRVIAIRPSTANPKAKPIWVAQFDPAETSQWFQIFNELSSVGKQMHPGSIKEGYLCYGGTESQHRKYVALFSDRIQFHSSRVDTRVESTLPLSVGFDVLYKDNSIYLSKSSNAAQDVNDADDYARFSNAVGGEVLGSWLQAFQDAYQARTPSPVGVRVDCYTNVSFNKGQQQFRYVILLADKISIFTARSLAFPNAADTQPVLANAEHSVSFVPAQLQVTQLGSQRIQIQVMQAQLVLDFRADYESQAFFNEINSAPAPPSSSAAPTPSGLVIPPSPGGQSRFSMAIASPSTRKAPGFHLTPPSLDDDEAPPPPVFIEEEDDAPPPPPPDFDEDDAPPSDFGVSSHFAPPPPQQPPAPAAASRAMPLYDSDDDDDLPDFIKEKRRQQALAAAAPPAPAPAPTPTPTSTFTAPVTTSSSFKAPITSSTSSNGLGLDFEFTFDLPPAPVFDLPPPGPADDEQPAAAPVASLGVQSSVKKPLFGANRSAAAAAVASPVTPVVDSRYVPVDFDVDDDDLPPPGGK